MKRCCAGFLRAGQNEVEPVDLFAGLRPKHQSKCKRNFRVQAIVFAKLWSAARPRTAFARGWQFDESDVSTRRAPKAIAI
jgi:hypothetical protein